MMISLCPRDYWLSIITNQTFAIIFLAFISKGIMNILWFFLQINKYEHNYGAVSIFPFLSEFSSLQAKNKDPCLCCHANCTFGGVDI